MSETTGREWDLKKVDVKRVRIGMVILLVLAAVIIGGIALFGGGGGGSDSSQGESANAEALSSAELIARAGTLSGPAYWIGPRAGTDSYELTDTPDGRIYIRYLTNGAEAGDPRPIFLTVGSYPVENARQALRSSASPGGGQKLSRGDGYEVLSSPQATSAYVVFDEQPDVEVEVFSPEAGEAAGLVKAGLVKPLR